MGVIEPVANATPGPATKAADRVNDFAIAVATANGTGSQTSNLTLLRALFKMGIPVNGKNIFPSNIQGLPTWYHIRVSKDGYVARRETSEVLVAFNEVTVHEDIRDLPAGGMCLYNDDWRNMPVRDDIVMYGIPVNQFLREPARDKSAPLHQHDLRRRHLAAGHRPRSHLRGLGYIFSRRDICSRTWTSSRWHDRTAQNTRRRDPFVEPMNLTEGKFDHRATRRQRWRHLHGMTVTAWYPITPSTSLWTR